VTHSATAQVNPAVAAASVVVAKALEAMASAPSAEPALKPYQPTQSMPVPTMQSTIECGGMGSLPKPSAGPEDDAEHERAPARGHVHHGAAGEVDRLDAAASD
jgi:hypothetical protein